MHTFLSGELPPEAALNERRSSQEDTVEWIITKSAKDAQSLSGDETNL